MKLEEADKRLLNLLCLPSLDVRLSADDLNAFEKMRSYAEATRWRKLSEEKPPERFEQYQVWIDFEDGTYVASHLHWHDRDGYWHFSGLPCKITHWSPIVGPEEEE